MARRSELKTPKYLSKNSNIRKMLKSYPLTILKVMSESSKISNLGQIFIFTENCTPNYPYESFSLPPNYCQNQYFLRTPNYLFPTKIPYPKLLSQPPPVSLTVEWPPWVGMALILSKLQHFYVNFDKSTSK